MLLPRYSTFTFLVPLPNLPRLSVSLPLSRVMVRVSPSTLILTWPVASTPLSPSTSTFSLTLLPAFGLPGFTLASVVEPALLTVTVNASVPALRLASPA